MITHSTPTVANSEKVTATQALPVTVENAPAVAAESEPRPESEALESPGDVVADGADSANVWPDAQAEAAFISETRGRGEPVVLASPEVMEEVAAKPLPTLDEMVKRIPVETRDLLDELFRAKFTAVRRVKKVDLKS